MSKCRDTNKFPEILGHTYTISTLKWVRTNFRNRPVISLTVISKSFENLLSQNLTQMDVWYTSSRLCTYIPLSQISTFRLSMKEVVICKRSTCKLVTWAVCISREVRNWFLMTRTEMRTGVTFQLQLLRGLFGECFDSISHLQP